MRIYQLNNILQNGCTGGDYGSNAYNFPREYYSKEEVDKEMDILKGRYNGMFEKLVAAGKRQP